MLLSDDVLTVLDDPPVFLDATYVDQLQALAASAQLRQPAVANRLLHEIERATVMRSDEIPPNVVNIGSEVTFRDEVSQRVRVVRVVLPFEADIAQRRISVLTPMGAALIGLPEGSTIAWETRVGEMRHLTVLKVRAQIA